MNHLPIRELAIPGFVALICLELAVSRVLGRVRHEPRDAMTSLR